MHILVVHAMVILLTIGPPKGWFYVSVLLDRVMDALFDL